MINRILGVVPRVAVQAKQWNQHCMTEIYSKFAMTMAQKNNTSVWLQWISMKKARSREKKKYKDCLRTQPEAKPLFMIWFSPFPRYNHRRVVEGACVRISSQNRSNTSVSVRNRKLDFFAKKQFQYFWNCGKRSLMEQGKNDRPLNKIARKLCLRRSFFYNRYF